MSSASASKEPSHLRCGHYNQNLSKTVYYQHKRLYYDRPLKKWYPHRVRDDDSVPVVAFVPNNTSDAEFESSCNISDDDQSSFHLTFQEGECLRRYLILTSYMKNYAESQSEEYWSDGTPHSNEELSVSYFITYYNTVLVVHVQVMI